MKILDKYYNLIESSKHKDKFLFAESLITAIIIALLIRQFVVASFIIPTNSMSNTLIKGDFLIGTKFNWGAEIPFTHRRLASFGNVHHNDIIIFKSAYPPYDDYIKRCVAVAGDTIEYKNKVIYLNSKRIVNDELICNSDSIFVDSRDNFGPYIVPKKDDLITYNRDNIQSISFFRNLVFQENPYDDITVIHRFSVGGTIMDTIDLGVEKIVAQEFAKEFWSYNLLQNKLDQLNKKILNANITITSKVLFNDVELDDYRVKSDCYFMLGDNRDESLDSRYWGFVSYRSFVAQPVLVLANFPLHEMFTKGKFDRIGTTIQ